MYIDVHFEPYFVKAKLKDNKTSTLELFYNEKLTKEVTSKSNGRKYTMSINTVIKPNKFIKAALNYAVINGDIKSNPVLGGRCGLRRGEIFGLRWKDIDLTNKTITIRNTIVRVTEYHEKDPKNEKSQRTITVPGYVVTVLKLYKVRSKRTGAEDKLITAWKPGYYSTRYKDLVDSFGLPITRLHDLRHYNATIMMFYNVPDKVAAQPLEHSNLTMLHKTYQHVLDNMDSTAADRNNESMKNKNSQQVSNT